jgi:hypothetical protein
LLVSFLALARAVIADLYGLALPRELPWMAGLAMVFWFAFGAWRDHVDHRQGRCHQNGGRFFASGAT